MGALLNFITPGNYCISCSNVFNQLFSHQIGLFWYDAHEIFKIIISLFFLSLNIGWFYTHSTAFISRQLSVGSLEMIRQQIIFLILWTFIC